MRLAELDAVTIDGYGTLLRLADPVPPLVEALRKHGFERGAVSVRAAFSAEVAYYGPRAVLGRDPESLAALRHDCTRVFLEDAHVSLEPGSFVDDFMSSIVFELEPGSIEVVAGLRGRGIDLAVVSNWDIGLHEHLELLGAASLFSTIVTTAEAGAPKPDPAVFRLALARLGVGPERALHVGDEDADEAGALAAGMRFTRAPLVNVLESRT